jgi:hypothetical protein
VCIQRKREREREIVHGKEGANTQTTYTKHWGDDLSHHAIGISAETNGHCGQCDETTFSPVGIAGANERVLDVVDGGLRGDTL